MIKQKPPVGACPIPIETTKVAEVRDTFGNLRYKVVLTNYDNIIEEEELYCKSYDVEVYNCFYDENPMLVVHKPGVGEPKIYDYWRALDIYEGYKKHYTDLICAETRDIQDINIYKEKIDYKLVDTKCCAHCAHCKTIKDAHDHVIGRTGIHVCANPKLIKINYLDFCSTSTVDACGFHIGNKHEHHLDLCPRVDLNGVCKDFTKSIKHVHDVDGMSLIDIVYGKLNKKFDEFTSKLSSDIALSAVDGLSGTIEEQINNQIDNAKQDIVNIVGKAIEDQLRDGIIIDGDDSTEEYGD